jgi:hypothetical protein
MQRTETEEHFGGYIARKTKADINEEGMHHNVGSRGELQSIYNPLIPITHQTT